MTVEGLKTIFDWVAVILLFLTFASGVGALITGNVINKRQAEQLRQFDTDLTGAKIELGKQQERAAKLEAGNLALKTGLENAKTDSRNAESKLEREQQKTADAQKQAAEAQLALKNRVHRVDVNSGFRRLKPEFVAAFAGKPKGTAEIWYNSGDKEAYLFATQIQSAMSKGAGWKVSDPTPIPQEGGDSGAPASAPPEVRWGSGNLMASVSVRMRRLPTQPSFRVGENSAEGAISQAFSIGLIQSGVAELDQDFTMPEGHFRIVVGQKLNPVIPAE